MTLVYNGKHKEKGVRTRNTAMNTSDTSNEIAAFPSSNENKKGQAGLRELSDTELEEILTLHQSWLDLRDENGNMADLSLSKFTAIVINDRQPMTRDRTSHDTRPGFHHRGTG